jgi:hypothetical protein
MRDHALHEGHVGLVGWGLAGAPELSSAALPQAASNAAAATASAMRRIVGVLLKMSAASNQVSVSGSSPGHAQFHG